MGRQVNPNIPEDGFISKKEFLDTGSIASSDLTVVADRDASKGIAFDANSMSAGKSVTFRGQNVASNIVLTLPAASGTLSTSAGGGNAFGIVQPITGTSPTASIPADTLTLVSGDSSVSIAGNSSTNTIDIRAVSSGPMTTLGDTTYEDATPTPARLAGNTTTTKKMLSQTGTGTISAAPVWSALASGDIPDNAANTTGSAAKWTTARNLAGNSVDGSANVAFTNKFVAQGTADTGLSGAQFLGALSTGIVKNTTTTGVLSIAVAGDFPTLNQNTTGSAAKWTTARNLAGNSVDGSAAVAFSNSFIVQGTADSGLTGAQFMGALGTGIVKNTTTTGVQSIAVAGDFPTLNQNTSGTASNITASSNSSLTTLSSLALPASQLTGTLAAGQFPALTGDLTTSAGALATTLATVNSNVGSFGSTTAIPNITVNGKGLITAASTSAVVAPAGTVTGTTLAANVVTSSLTTVGTIGTGVWNGTCTAGNSFLNSGTTYTTPSGITANTQFKFTLVGAGGGGGGASTTVNQKGGGGGSGGTIIVYLTGLTASTGYTIAIGSGGTGVSAATGNAGGNTTLLVNAVTYTAAGGAGGLAAGAGFAAGGAGGTTTNGTIGITGGQGGSGAAPGIATASGFGANSMFGYGGQIVGSSATGGNVGLAAAGFGAGGGGSAAGQASATATVGGSGTQGFILVEWYN